MTCWLLAQGDTNPSDATGVRRGACDCSRIYSMFCFFAKLYFNQFLFSNQYLQKFPYMHIFFVLTLHYVFCRIDLNEILDPHF